MSKISPKKLAKYIDKAAKSNVAKSTRRFFFNHLYESAQYRGYFHVDLMYGLGSGVLLRFDDEFFILTAKHVIANNVSDGFQNESPFWFSVKDKARFSAPHDILFPKRIWNIGELVHFADGDLCLIELFYPKKFHMPDHFIEIKDKTSFLTKKEFFDGQLLLTTGYPFEKNSFDFTPINKDYSHSTKVQRHTIPGVYLPKKGVGFISFEMTGGNYKHENINGMSGGAVYNVQFKANQVKLAGIPLTAGNNICRFLPSYLFIDAIINYKDASCNVVDPVVENPPNLEDILKIELSYLRKYDPKFNPDAEAVFKKTMQLLRGNGR